MSATPKKSKQDLSSAIKTQIQTIMNRSNQRGIKDIDGFVKDVISIKQGMKVSDSLILQILRNGRLGIYGTYFSMNPAQIRKWIIQERESIQSPTDKIPM